MRIIWSPNSLKQLENIGDYIAIDSPGSTRMFIDKLIVSVERLKQFPLSGSNVPESPNLKQVLVQGHRIIYRPRDLTIEIIAVLCPFQL
ncbi:MAG: type II toxin-antitoxin system RelE/ParE family toxin [Bacteriovorax sp.]|nr:type II toxin-antitoxin system RelE/ParE family toxin [Bacteriovorax sp.]